MLAAPTVPACRCLSSKYFFWDPDYAWLSLGRYGALREIAWVRAAHAVAADLRYYYLGYYIHTCPKMAYKAEYAPSELLCPQRQVWVEINNTVLQALDRTPYVVLSDLPGVRMQPNLSVPRPLPVPAAAGSVRPGFNAGGSSASSAADTPAAVGFGAAAGADSAGLLSHGAMHESVGVNTAAQTGVQEQFATQQQRQALDSQLLFLLKQPLRWGALRESGMLAGEQIGVMEDRLTDWQAVVGETAAHLLYATPSDLLSV